MTARADNRWHWTDLCILLATVLAALLLLLVIRHEADRSIPIRPVACVQHAASDGRGLPQCDGGQIGAVA